MRATTRLSGRGRVDGTAGHARDARLPGYDAASPQQPALHLHVRTSRSTKAEMLV